MEQLKTFKKGYKSLRKGRRSIPNYYYLVTTKTHERLPVFTSNGTARMALESLQWLDRQDLFLLDTVVVMPDHVHILGRLKDAGIEKIMQKFKSYTAKEINRLLNRSGKLWQAGYHEHAVRKDEDLNQIRKYCLNNPVRAGLVADFHTYRFWYCRWKV